VWREVQEARVWQPTVDTVVDLGDESAVVQAIQRVRSHHVKGKVVIHVADQ
jgi:hypothetical protein